MNSTACTNHVVLTLSSSARTVTPPIAKTNVTNNRDRSFNRTAVQSTVNGATVMSASNTWNIYRTRFLVRARQLTEPLVFTDSLGREHSGQPGDYLVETSDGIRRITSRALFEDIYVPLDPDFNAPAVDDVQKRPSCRVFDQPGDRVSTAAHTRATA